MRGLIVFEASAGGWLQSIQLAWLPGEYHCRIPAFQLDAM
jgi:hypothetical protein